MEYRIFEDAMKEIYATFGKKTPEYNVMQAVYKRVKDLPDKFITFCERHFQNQNDLPKNFGKFVMDELWPKFLDRNPELKGQRLYGCCPNCISRIPGFREVYEPFLFKGEIHYTPRIFRCPCGNAPNPNNDPAPTDDELLAHGWLLKLPYKHTKEETIAKFVKLKQAILPEPKTQDIFVQEQF